MNLNLFIRRGFPIEWPDEALNQFQQWLKAKRFTKDDVLYIKSEPSIVGEALTLTLTSVMPGLRITQTDTLDTTLPTFICESDVNGEDLCERFPSASSFMHEWLPLLPTAKFEIKVLDLEHLPGQARQACLCEAKKWQDTLRNEGKQAVVLSDLCFKGTFPKEVTKWRL